MYILICILYNSSSLYCRHSYKISFVSSRQESYSSHHIPNNEWVFLLFFFSPSQHRLIMHYRCLTRGNPKDGAKPEQQNLDAFVYLNTKAFNGALHRSDTSLSKPSSHGYLAKVYENTYGLSCTDVLKGDFEI